MATQATMIGSTNAAADSIEVPVGIVKDTEEWVEPLRKLRAECFRDGHFEWVVLNDSVEFALDWKCTALIMARRPALRSQVLGKTPQAISAMKATAVCKRLGTDGLGDRPVRRWAKGDHSLRLLPPKFTNAKFTNSFFYRRSVPHADGDLRIGVDEVLAVSSQGQRVLDTLRAAGSSLSAAGKALSDKEAANPRGAKGPGKSAVGSLRLATDPAAVVGNSSDELREGPDSPPTVGLAATSAGSHNPPQSAPFVEANNGGFEGGSGSEDDGDFQDDGGFEYDGLEYGGFEDGGGVLSVPIAAPSRVTAEVQTLPHPALSRVTAEAQTSPHPALSRVTAEAQTSPHPALSRMTAEAQTSPHPALSRVTAEAQTSPHPAPSRVTAEAQTSPHPALSRVTAKAQTSPADMQTPPPEESMVSPAEAAMLAEECAVLHAKLAAANLQSADYQAKLEEAEGRAQAAEAKVETLKGPRPMLVINLGTGLWNEAASKGERVVGAMSATADIAIELAKAVLSSELLAIGAERLASALPNTRFIRVNPDFRNVPNQGQWQGVSSMPMDCGDRTVVEGVMHWTQMLLCEQTPKVVAALRQAIADDAYIILSYDGGGIRGCVPAVFTRMVETQLGRALSQVAHLIIGTSIGGAGALAVALSTDIGEGPSKALRLLEQLRLRFAAGRLKKPSSSWNPLSQAPSDTNAIPDGAEVGLYDIIPLVYGVDESLGPLLTEFDLTRDTKLSDIPPRPARQGQPARPRLVLVTATRPHWNAGLETTSGYVPYLLSNFQLPKLLPGWHLSCSWPIWKAVQATSAAKTYFPAVQHVCEWMVGAIVEFVDGAFACNNPSELAVQLGNMFRAAG